MVELRSGGIGEVERIDNGWIVTTHEYHMTVRRCYTEWHMVLTALTMAAHFYPVGTNVKSIVEATR